MSHSPERNSWAAMVARCENQKHNRFQYYGGRGIKVCARWRESFAAFLEDMGPRPSPDHSVDRYPNIDGDYEPDNCRWATRLEQRRNRADIVNLTVDGVTRPVAEWAALLGVDYRTIHGRLENGWDQREAALLPPRPKRGAPLYYRAGRTPASSKTVCVRGHSLVDGDVAVTEPPARRKPHGVSPGWRVCRPCARERNARYEARRKAARATARQAERA